MKLSDIFRLGERNTKLYSDLFYEYQDYIYSKEDEKVAIYSSQRKILGYLPSSVLKPKSIHSTKYALIMYRKGKAGTLFIPFHENWSCSENAIPILLKEEYVNKIDLNYLIVLLQDIIYHKTTGKSDNANANWDMIKDINIGYNHNNEVIKEYKKIKSLIDSGHKFKKSLENQLKKSINIKGKKVRIEDIFYITSGIRITEKEVYDHEGDLPCVTSQTTNEGITWKADENWLKKFTKKNKQVIINMPCLTWTKDGFNAGTIFYRDYKFYPNDHCGVLLSKKESLNLQWFKWIYQQQIFQNVISKKIQGMLYEEQMKNIEIIFPDNETIQESISQEYEKLNRLRNALTILESELKKQLQKITTQ